MALLNLKVNGELHQIDTESDTPLLFILRNKLGLTGAKLGCGLEQCGASAVLINGESRLSCVSPASEFVDKDIITVEGLSSFNQLTTVQRAFVKENAAQCGYCIPGIIITITALFNRPNIPTDIEIQQSLQGHLCRCGTHARILSAIGKLHSEM